MPIRFISSIPTKGGVSVQSTFNMLVAFAKAHPVGSLLLAFAILSSILQDVMFRRYATRKVTFTGFLWVVVGWIANFIPKLLWNVIFLVVCGLQVGTVILILPVLYMTNKALKIYVDIFFAKIRNRFIRTITFIIGTLAFLIEWRVLPRTQFMLPYRDFISNAINVLPMFTIRVVGLVLVAEVAACCLLLLYPRKFVDNKMRGRAPLTAADQEVLVRLQKVLSMLPQSNWLARQFLRMQAFLLGALDKYFFAGGALLQNTMNAFMALIHSAHVFVVNGLQKRRAAKPKAA